MKFLFLVFLLPLKLLAQDITGVWTGTLYNDTTKQYLRYELAISEYNGKLSDYSHTIFIIDSVENIGVKSIKIKKSGENYFIEDDKLIYNNYAEQPAKGVKTYSQLALSETDSSMVLSGGWKTNTTKIYRSITGNIFLKKKKKIEETLIIPKLENLGVAKSLSFMTYNNYSKDMATTNKPVMNLQGNKKPGQNIEKNTSTNNSLLLNSPEKKEAETKVKQASTASQDIVTNNKPILDQQLNKSREKDISKRNPSPDSKPLSTSENKEAEPKSKQTPDSGNLSITHAADQKNQHDNNKTLIEDSVLHKKETVNTIDKKEKEIGPEPLLTAKRGISKNDISKASSINNAVDRAEIKEKNEQINSAKILSGNNKIIKADVTPVSKAASEISTRKIETIQSVEIKNDSLLLTLYDNGEIDGDTVSVLMNGKVIMPMQGLTASGISKTIYLTPEMGDSIVLIMYAENLGSIPPNTGLLIVHDGEARHEIRFTGDLQKNSAIILRRKKKI